MTKWNKNMDGTTMMATTFCIGSTLLYGRPFFYLRQEDLTRVSFPPDFRRHLEVQVIWVYLWALQSMCELLYVFPLHMYEVARTFNHSNFVNMIQLSAIRQMARSSLRWNHTAAEHHSHSFIRMEPDLQYKSESPNLTSDTGAGYFQ